MDKSFIQVVEAFKVLKTKFQSGDISRQEFIDEMKKLRIRDDQGRFWMIGAQTGKWYLFRRKGLGPGRAAFAERPESDLRLLRFREQARVGSLRPLRRDLGEGPSKCPRCGAMLERPFWIVRIASPTWIEKEKAEKTANLDLDKLGRVRNGVYDLRSVQPLSLFLFGGVLGLVLGVVLGAFAGATDFFLRFF